MGQVNDQSIGLEALERDATSQSQSPGSHAQSRQAERRRRGHPAGQRQAGIAGSAWRGAELSAKTLIAFLGAVGGLLLGSAIALLREGSDQTFRRADQIEQTTGLPVLAMVPQIGGRTPPSMQVLRQPTSNYSESLRACR